MRVRQLEVGYDLDRPADLARLMDELAGTADNPDQGRWREALGRIVPGTLPRT